MSRRRWIADEFDAARGRAVLTGANADHLIRVLRARAGEEFEVVVPAAGAKTRRARIASIVPMPPQRGQSKSAQPGPRVEFELGEELPPSPPAVSLWLLLAVFKFDRMEWALEKAVELGAERVAPVIAERTQRHLALAAPRRAERWRRIAREAAQQSRRATVPEISAPLPLAGAIASRPAAGIVLAESGAVQSLRQALAVAAPRASLALAVGPEGGWSEGELALFRNAGWLPASLGANILRAETAALAALAIVAAELASRG